jgi:NAD(P)-dependent dehydrogenase (short-subunit alcohol dehydrogenase family)
MELEGSVAIVTGAAGGVGRATVELFRSRGARIVAEDIKEEVAELESEEVATLVGDVADVETARRAVALAQERFGALQILVNNAGRFLMKPITETAEEEWDELLRVNVRGAFLHSREALPALAESGDGQAAYCSTKGAIVQLTRQLAIEQAPRVRVNAVAPGAIDTPFVDAVLGFTPDRDERLAAIAAQHPLGRLASAEEIAEVIAFLASPRSSIVTGAVLLADGGFTAQ